MVVEELSDHDMASRSTVAERLIGILSDDGIILMTDEAHFHLSGYINEQSTQNPHYHLKSVPSTSFPNHYSPIILSPDAIQS
jgi:hypothetical protein